MEGIPLVHDAFVSVSVLTSSWTLIELCCWKISKERRGPESKDTNTNPPTIYLYKIFFWSLWNWFIPMVTTWAVTNAKCFPWPGHVQVMHIHISKKILPDDQVEGFLPGEYRVEAQYNFHLTGLHWCSFESVSCLNCKTCNVRIEGESTGIRNYFWSNEESTSNLTHMCSSASG